MKKRICLAVMVLVFALFSSTAFADSYTGIGNGRNGEVEVTVDVDGGVITSVEVGTNSETPAISSYAFERIPSLIVEHQTLNVDAVSGATFSSNAVKNAVKAALQEAGLNPDDY